MLECLRLRIPEQHQFHCEFWCTLRRRWWTWLSWTRTRCHASSWTRTCRDSCTRSSSSLQARCPKHVLSFYSTILFSQLISFFDEYSILRTGERPTAPRSSRAADDYARLACRMRRTFVQALLSHVRWQSLNDLHLLILYMYKSCTHCLPSGEQFERCLQRALVSQECGDRDAFAR